MDIHAAFRRRTAELLARSAGQGSLPFGLAASVAPPRDGVDCDVVVVLASTRGGLGSGVPARRFAGELEREPGVAAAVPVAPGLLHVTLTGEARADALAALLRDALGRAAGPPPGTAFAGVVERCRRGDVPLGEARAAALADMSAGLDAAADGDGLVAGRRRRAAGECGPVGPVSVLAARGGAATDGGLRTALDAIGPEALRFALAAARPAAPLVLDLDRLAERSRINPAFWIRYAHARARSLLRGGAAAPSRFAPLRAPGEVAAIRTVLRHPSVVSNCAETRSAHRLAAHLSDLAMVAYDQWDTSKDQPQLRFVNEEQRDLAKARLGLVTACTLVLASGLGIFGVSAPDEMS